MLIKMKSIIYWIFAIIFSIWFVWGGSYDSEDLIDIVDIRDYYGDNPSKIRISGKHNPHFLYFDRLPISYSFDEDNLCYGKKLSQVRESFDILIKETSGIMNFTELESNGDIIISCMNYEDYYGGAAGYGGPEFYEGEQKILNGFVELYEIGYEYVDCESYPTTALHEILHALGFDHLYNKSSIMYVGDEEYAEYEWEYCQHLDTKISKCLKNIYSNGINGSSCDGLSYLF